MSLPDFPIAGVPKADGQVYLAYRLRLPIGAGRGISNVVARSAGGIESTRADGAHDLRTELA